MAPPETEVRFCADSKLSIVRGRCRGVSRGAFGDSISPFFAVQNDRHVFKIENCRNGSNVLYDHKDLITSIAASNSAALVTSADMKGNCVLASDSCIVSFSASDCPIWSSCFAPVGGIFVVGADDGLIQMFDTGKRNLLRMMVGHRRSVTGVQFHPNCALIGSLARDGSARIWDTRLGTSVRLFHMEPKPPSCQCFSPNGAIYGFFDGHFNICDIGSGTVKEKVELPVTDICLVALGSGSTDAYAVSERGRVFRISRVDSHPDVIQIADFKERVVACRLTATDELAVITNIPHHFGYSSL
jgi:WD40 repeat protein